MTALAVETVLSTNSLILAFCALLAGLDVVFVLAIAWMRPAGSVEHHPSLDELVDDGEP